MDVMDFQTQYNAGRQTLGTTAPVSPPVMLTYLYRAFMPRKTNGGTAALIKYTYRAFVFPGTGPSNTYGAFPVLPARSPDIPPIIQ
jgi:hypothetical protein